MSKVQNEGYEILRVLCGSRAYGLHSEESDFDYHSIYVVPTTRLLSIGPKIKASSSVGDSEDNTAWELQHFLELALKGNPTVIETFVAPSVPIPQELPPLNLENTSLGEELRALFPYIVSRRAVYDSFRGYASSQMHKATVRETNLRRQLKAASAYVRTLWHGTMLLKYGTYETMLPKEIKEVCMFYRTWSGDEFPKHNFQADSARMEECITKGYRYSKVPEEANIEKVNEFLVGVRKEVW